MPQKIVAISGSLRKDSKNTALMRAAIRLNSSPDLVIEEYDISTIPLYNQDLEVGQGEEMTFPESVTALRKAVRESNGLLLVTPEHNYMMSAAMKNVLDWLSRGTVLKEKVIALMSAAGSAGGSNATSGLQSIFEKLTWLSLRVISPQVNVQLFDGVQKFNESNDLVHEPTIEAIQFVFSELQK